jgi:hypothetical protein
MCAGLLSRRMTLMRATETLKKLLGPTQSIDGVTGAESTVTIRYARPDDALSLLDLAALDSSSAPRGVVLVAEVEGRLWAALSLEDGHAIADPFRPSGELSFLLAERARQIARTMPRDNDRLRRLTPSAA